MYVNVLTTVAVCSYITSDCGAESDVFANHHYTKTPEESLKSILEAGTDNGNT